MDYAPVVLFAYNRKDKLEKCVHALEGNRYADETELFVFADGPKEEEDKEKVRQVRAYLERYAQNSRFKNITIYKSEVNKGLANSVISGVSEVIDKKGRVIVVEDDIITTQDFLSYMNGGLEYYKDIKNYGSISAYTSPLSGLEKYDKDIYVTRKGECWGWATWKDRWDKVDWELKSFENYLKDRKERRNFEKLQAGIDRMLISQMNGEIDSWAVRWCYYLFQNKLLTVYPRISKVQNIGFDGSGTHGVSDIKNSDIRENVQDICRFEILPVNLQLEKENAEMTKRAFFQRIFDKIAELMKK